MSVSVRVYTRTRPFNKRELGIGDCELCFGITKTDINVPERKRKFTFDHNFGPKADQDEVFGVIGVNVTKDFMDGFNATQFVYGQTGSGKTWTMMGIEGHRGIIPRTSSFIFECIANKESGWEFEIHASYLEVYMERVNDLMDANKTNLDVKEDKAS
jgi:primosomal protein N'